MWEYDVKGYKDTGLLKAGLNKFAQENWEVVSINIYSDPGLSQILFNAATSSGFVVTYKRKKQ